MSLDFTEYEWRSAIEDFWDTNPSRPGVKRYAGTLIKGVMENIEALDAEIEGGLGELGPGAGRAYRAQRDPWWRCMRCAMARMCRSAVAINEAIEVAKRFGADEAPRFINGCARPSLEIGVNRRGNPERRHFP